MLRLACRVQFPAGFMDLAAVRGGNLVFIGRPRSKLQYVAPSGTKMISTSRPSFPAAVFPRASTREVSTLLFSSRYFFALWARCAASFCAARSWGSAWPTKTIFAFGSLCRRTATSSSVRLHTLSARALFKAKEHSLILLASGAGGGACTVIVVEQSQALWTPFSARPVTV